MSDADPREQGEQFAKDLESAVEETVEDWVEDTDSSGSRNGEYISIKKKELVDKLVQLNAMTAIRFAED